MQGTRRLYRQHTACRLHLHLRLEQLLLLLLLLLLAHVPLIRPSPQFGTAGGSDLPRHATVKSECMDVFIQSGPPANNLWLGPTSLEGKS